MDSLRTPDSCFENLTDYDFLPHYVEVDGLRIHYVDEGPPEAPPLVCFHGEPTWSYLYRNMIPKFVAAGHRVLAPDLVGFGRSDKPSSTSDYTYERHVGWMRGWLEALKVQNATLVCHDWGGLIGLRLLAEVGDRFARAVASNTFLPTGDHETPEAFLRWREFSQVIPEFPVGQIVQSGSTQELAPEVIAAYDAPFPEEKFKAGARIFPSLVPATPDDPASAANRDAWQALYQWQKPFLVAFSDSDPITGSARPVLEKLIPGAQGQPNPVLAGGGHFIQEDCGPALADAIVRWIDQLAT